MKQMDALYTMLQQNAELYESFIKIEYDKYDAVIRDDIKKLDEIISKEQVFCLRLKGHEQNREKLMLDMNMKDKTLKEIIEIADDDQSSKLKLMYDRLFKALLEFRKISEECKTIIEVRLHRIETAMSKLSEKENIYTNGDNYNNIKSLIISKKI